MTPELEQKKQLAIQYYLPQYEQIVADRLGHIKKISELFLAFNAAFPDTPDGQKWITHPDSLRDGQVTCDMTAVLLALWWSLFHSVSSVVVALHDISRYERSYLEVHYLIGLPSKNLSSEAETVSFHEQRTTDQTYLNDQIDNLDIAWLHWLREDGLQTIGAREGILMAPGNVVIKEVDARHLAIDRIKNHKLPHTPQILASSRSLFIGKNSESSSQLIS